MQRLFFLILWMGFGGSVAAQVDTLSSEVIEEAVAPEMVEEYEENSPPSPVVSPFSLPVEPVTAREIPPAQWDKATQGLNYSDDVPKPVKTQEPRQRNLPNWDWDGDFWAGLFRILAIIVLVALIGWVVYNVVQSPQNRLVRARDGTLITLDNLDAHIQETDLDHFLRRALAEGNYTQATRIYYLQVIKSLSLRDYIRWSREKTNRDYLQEMTQHPLATEFRGATRAYEDVWYGDRPLDEPAFRVIEGNMQSLMGQLDHPKG